MYAQQASSPYHFHTPSANEFHHTQYRAPEFIHEIPRDPLTPAAYMLVYHQTPHQYQQSVRHHFSPASRTPAGKIQVQGSQITGARVITPIMTEFPSTFKPRTDPNMPHKEKVARWICELPIYPLNATAITTSSSALSQGDWHNGCYPGVISSGSSLSQSESQKNLASQETHEFDDDHYNYGWGTPGYSFDMNSPSRNYTMARRMTNAFHLMFGKDQLFVEQEDVVEYQAHKLTRYVRRMYRMDNSEHVRKGPRPEHSYNVLDSSYNGFSCPSPTEYEFDNDDFFDSDDPYMNRLGFKNQEHIMLTLREFQSIREQAEMGSAKHEKSWPSHVPTATLPPPPPVRSRRTKRLSLSESAKVKNKTPQTGVLVTTQDDVTPDAFELMATCDLRQAQHISSRASLAMRAHFDFHSPLQGLVQSPLLGSQAGGLSQ